MVREDDILRKDESPERSGDLPRPIESTLGKGFLERIEGAPLPIVRLFGWFSHSTIPPAVLSTDRGRQLQPLTVSRMLRPDVLAAEESSLPDSGFRMDFLLEDGEQPTSVEFEQKHVYDFPADLSFLMVKEDESGESSEVLPRAIESSFGKGFLERIEGEPLPIVRLFGWFSDTTIPPAVLSTDQGRQLQPLTVSRMFRPDVLAAQESSLPYSGFRMDFLLEDGEQPTRIEFQQRHVYDFPGDSGYGSISPHYRNFFTRDAVMGRDAIYGSGPPTNVSAEFKEFASAASGEVLDFGCGNGDLLSFLRDRGAVAAGLELDETRVRVALKPEAEPYVSFYPGGTPLPFEDESFDWIVSTEVIEHVPDIARFVPEFARILRADGRLLVTTPDITSIPSSYPAGCVPWHLLESTHINFFTPQSVIRLFATYFVPESMYCLGATRINGLFVPGSIGAIFTLRPQEPR